MSAEEIIELQQELKEYHPGKASKSPDRIAFPENLYIGLFGKTGCGKTSLINSIKYAADGKLRKTKWLQVAPQDKAGGHTMHRKLANITDNIFLIDNRGLDDPSSAQAIEELSAQLDGRRSYHEVVNWQKVEEGADDALHLEKGDADGQHPIGCAVFVFNANHELEENTNGLVQVIDYFHIHQGHYPVAVITHVDVVTEALVEGLITVLRSTGVSDIFKVANLTDEQPKLLKDYQLNLLNLMDRCMTDGDETLIYKHYELKGRQRKEAKEEQQRKINDQKRKELEEKLREQERRAEEERRVAEERRVEAERRAEERQDQAERRAEERQDQAVRRAEERQDQAERRAAEERWAAEERQDQAERRAEERRDQAEERRAAEERRVAEMKIHMDQLRLQKEQTTAREKVASLEDTVMRMERARENEAWRRAKEDKSLCAIQ